MRNSLSLSFVSLSLAALALVTLTGCNSANDDTNVGATGPGAGQQATAPAAAGMTGSVLETMDSGGYTYVNVDVAGRAIWAAGPQVELAVGDTVTIPPGMEMRGYHSKTLDRTFESVWFVTAIQVHGAGSAAAGAAPSHGGKPPAPATAVTDVAPLEGGQTVLQIVRDCADLAGTPIAVRGQVVKFNGGIMGTNWLHLQDGTGSAADGTNDLTVTTDATVAVGDIVVVRGAVTVDKDFGAGYSYAVIIEKAAVSAE